MCATPQLPLPLSLSYFNCVAMLCKCFFAFVFCCCFVFILSEHFFLVILAFKQSIIAINGTDDGQVPFYRLLLSACREFALKLN